MSQPEQVLEDKLIGQLTTLGYEYAHIPNEAALLQNLQQQLGPFNETEFSQREFKAIRKQHFKQTFFWADEQNNNITDLHAFTETFLNQHHLGKMILQYIVFNETFKILMVLRPYQYYAVEAIIEQVRPKSLREPAGSKQSPSVEPSLTRGIASVAPLPSQ